MFPLKRLQNLTVFSFFSKILKSIDRKCGIEIHSDDDTKSKSTTRRPHRLSVGHSNESILLDMHSKEFSDIVSYISDTLHTLKCFMVNVYPAACELFFKVQNNRLRSKNTAQFLYLGSPNSRYLVCCFRTIL